MKLRDAINLQVGDTILCNACQCNYAEVKIVGRCKFACGCIRIYHAGSGAAIVINASECENGDGHEWGLFVTGGKIKLISKKDG